MSRFIKVTPRADRAFSATYIRSDAIVSVDVSAGDDRRVSLQTASNVYEVLESPDQILALISGGAGDEAVTDEMVRAARTAFDAHGRRAESDFDDWMRAAIAAALRARPRP